MGRKLSAEEVEALGLEAPAPVPAPQGGRRRLSAEEAAELGLESSPATTPKQKTSVLDAITSGLGQVPIGLGDELGAYYQAERTALRGLGDVARGKGSLGELLPEALKTYRQARFENRGIDRAAAEEHPAAFYGALAGGSAATAPLTRGATVARGSGFLPNALAAMRTGFGQGAAYGAGASEADVTRQGALPQLLFDTALGGGTGILGGLVGQGIQSGAGFVADKMRAAGGRLLNRALAKTQELGAKEAKAATLTARSEAGRETSALQRLREHIDELRAEGTPKALAELADIEGSGIMKQAKAEMFGKSVGGFKEQFGRAKAAQGAYAEALESEAQRAAEAAAKKAQSTVAPDVKSLFKMYGEPIMGAAGGTALGAAGGEAFDEPGIGGTLGSIAGTTGGLILGRTRAGKAIRDRVMKPGNQIALVHALQRLAGGVEATGRGTAALPRALGRTAPAASASSGVIGAFPQLAEWLKPPRDEDEEQQQLARLALLQGR